MREIWRYIVILIIVVIVIIGSELLINPKTESPTLACDAHIKAVGAAILLYAQDHNGVLPIINTSERRASPEWVSLVCNWCDKDEKDEFQHFLKCPKDSSRNITSYEMNPKLAGKNINNIPMAEWRTHQSFNPHRYRSTDATHIREAEFCYLLKFQSSPVPKYRCNFVML